MKFCSQCGTQLADDAQFCVNCGKPQSQVQQPVVEEPVVESPAFEQPIFEQPIAQPTYAQPVYIQPEPQYSTKAKVFGIVSMACGIAALFFAIIFFFNGFELIDYCFVEDAIASIFTMLMFIPAGIVGLIFNSKAYAGGYVAVMSRLGKIFSIISLALFAFDFMLVFIALTR